MVVVRSGVQALSRLDALDKPSVVVDGPIELNQLPVFILLLYHRVFTIRLIV